MEAPPTETSAVKIESLRMDNRLNPFGASVEEILACALDQNGLLGHNTKINGYSAKACCGKFYEKRDQFKQSTRLGDTLVKAGIIAEGQLREALEIQARSSKPLGEIIVSEGYCAQETMEMALSLQKELRKEIELLESAHSEWRQIWRRFVGFFVSDEPGSL